MKPPPATGKVEGLYCAEDGCGGVLQLWWTDRFNRWFYGCSRHPKCLGSLPANADGSPRGKPRKKSLQRSRNAAHAAFDHIWKNGHCSRSESYLWLQKVMDMREDQAHMYQMTEDQCDKVILMVKQKGPGTEFWSKWIRKGD